VRSVPPYDRHVGVLEPCDRSEHICREARCEPNAGFVHQRQAVPHHQRKAEHEHPVLSGPRSPRHLAAPFPQAREDAREIVVRPFATTPMKSMRQEQVPTPRLSMRRIREVPPSGQQCLTERVIARMLGMSTMASCIIMCGARASAGLSWPLPAGMDDESLELLLFPGADGSLAKRSATGTGFDLCGEGTAPAQRDPSAVVGRVSRRQSRGSGYTWLCTTCEAWKQRARPSIRQTHMVGRRCSSISRATLPSPQWRSSKCSTSKRGS